MTTKDPIETRPRRVTFSSEERCERAFAKEMTSGSLSVEPIHAADLWVGWQACWRYLERKVQEEFIAS